MNIQDKLPKLKDDSIDENFYYSGDKGPKIGVRFLQVILMSLSYAHGFITRNIFSLGIVAMTSNSFSTPANIPTYNWDNINVLLSAMIWSGIPVTFFGGFLGKRFGPKWFIVGSVLLNSIAFLAIPLAAEYLGSYGVMLCRIVEGLCFGILFTQAATVLGKWVPPEERSRMHFLCLGFVVSGLIVSSITAGLIAESAILGWTFIFYIYGGIGIFLALLVIIFSFQGPDVHPRITNEELKYLQTTLFERADNGTPWIEIFSSKHVWAIIIAIAGHNFSLIVGTTEIPLYLAHVTQFDLVMTGTLTALPSLTTLVTGIPLSMISDWIPKKGYLSVLNTRKIFQLSIIACSLCSFTTTFIPIAYRTWTVVLLCIAGIFDVAPSIGGADVNTLDLSPKYSGIIFGAAQTLAQCVSLFAPLVVHWICTDLTDASQWRIVFGISFAISTTSSIIFACFASAEKQNFGSSK